jgi:hypothetical protein
LLILSSDALEVFIRGFMTIFHVIPNEAPIYFVCHQKHINRLMEVSIMINKFKSLSFSFLISALSITSCHSMMDPRNGAIVLPVNVSNTHQHFTIRIPPTFKQISRVTDQAHTMSEFIPTTDNSPFPWSEIITVNSFPNSLVPKGINAHKWCRQLLQGIKGNTGTLINYANREYQGYQMAKFIVAYEGINNRPEIVVGKYFSGPSDMSGFQYAIALTNGMTQEQALERMRQFESTNTMVTDIGVD